jgi:hypothetical protein
MIDDPVAAMSNTVAADVTEMTDAITAMLADFEGAQQAVADALTAVPTGAGDLAGGTEGASFAPINWAAYSHEELYQMLRDRADVGDVSEIAAAWGRHAESLAGHADTVREQRAALTANWQGNAAELAAGRIDQLAELIAAIGTRAGQVQQAAQDSADALAEARRTMPAPPGQSAFTPTGGDAGLATAAGGGVVFAVGAVSVGGTSMFDTNFVGASDKSRAEDVMRGYESRLHGSDALMPSSAQTTAGEANPTGVTNAAGFVPGPSGAGAAPGGVRGAVGGVPWSQLTHNAPPEPSGGAVGRVPLPPGAGGLAMHNAVRQLLASGRVPGGLGGPMIPPFMPPGSGWDGDKTHERRQPNVEKGLFADERTASKPVIGE